jgi:hypothetical protein
VDELQIGEMMKINLAKFGFDNEVEIIGTLEKEHCIDNQPLVIVFGENHKNEMILKNAKDAIAFCDCNIIGCIGTEPQFSILSRYNFATELKKLHPKINLVCVEDENLLKETEIVQPKYNDYEFWVGEGKTIEHPFPKYPKRNQHPNTLKREKRFLEILFDHWDKEKIAILNLGRDHVLPILDDLVIKKCNYIYIRHDDEDGL